MFAGVRCVYVHPAAMQCGRLRRLRFQHFLKREHMDTRKELSGGQLRESGQAVALARVRPADV